MSTATFPILLDLGDAVRVKTAENYLQGRIKGLSVSRQPDSSFRVMYDVEVSISTTETRILQVSSDDVITAIA